MPMRSSAVSVCGLHARQTPRLLGTVQHQFRRTYTHKTGHSSQAFETAAGSSTWAMRLMGSSSALVAARRKRRDSTEITNRLQCEARARNIFIAIFHALDVLFVLSNGVEHSCSQFVGGCNILYAVQWLRMNSCSTMCWQNWHSSLQITHVAI